MMAVRSHQLSIGSSGSVSFIDDGDDGAAMTVDEVDGDSVVLRRPASVIAHGFKPPVGELHLMVEAR
jgi:hypothetical protein